MLKLLIIICTGLLVYDCCAQESSADAFKNEMRHLRSSSHYSVTRQFIVLDPGPPDIYARPVVVVATNVVHLDPSLLTVSCERVKKALLTELGIGDQWQGKITVQTHPKQKMDEGVTITSSVYLNKWSYRVDLPERMEAPKLVTAMVQVLLLEMANRNSQGRSAEIPVWLTEGLARQLILSSEVGLVIRSPGPDTYGFAVSRELRDERRIHPLTGAHEELHQFPPLTLHELSWPQEGQLRGAYGETYRSSAQLLVYDLLALPNGRTLMSNFINALPLYLNWQIAFRTAFQSQFATQRDFEKWWALRLVSFTGRDLSNIWSPEESFKKIDEIIRPSVQVRTAEDELPLRSEVSLQTIILEWDFLMQSQVLEVKIKQLGMLRTQVSQDTVTLVDNYRKVLEGYLKERNKGWFARLGRRQSTPGLDKVAQQITGQLDLLDREREQLRPKLTPGDTAGVEVGSRLLSH
ncbi:hypothetical protein [Pedosphaera parvula]|nr:hypothetical protein [Pedosphaera parvula]